MPPPYSADLEIATEPHVRDLAAALMARHGQLATAESCTGGLIAACCTAVAGSSQWFDRGVVTYSNQAKTELLGVPAPLIQTHGAVSQEVALAMAEGLLQRSAADWVVSVTGIAGPGGGSTEKPVGTVWLAWGQRGEPLRCERLQWAGDRRAVRQQTVLHALGRLVEAVSR
jgi:nicotinamide-nucleotide amidase